MNRNLINQLVNFVQQEFGVSRAEVITALHHSEAASQFPLILWQYGFITLQQLDRLFDWLASARLRSIDG
jgi:dTDP-4-dehydrorhamnose 3,5-epimerase-like enzyme